MKRTKVLAALAVVFCILFPLSAFADEPEYNAASEVTLKGNVVWFAGDPVSQRWNGAYVIMKDGANEIQVYLGPASFLERTGVSVKMGDDVRITGSRISWRASEIILARDITSGSKRVELRAPDGSPRW